ncbi:hypothetical protein AB0N05_16095 [Nocardia sp. NPDC051030]|uniref:hypothetical protein n=1 Tax=Nocardia sp. NPDC051030 TaxID=3155162 RepID=UPI00342B3263
MSEEMPTTMVEPLPDEPATPWVRRSDSENGFGTSDSEHPRALRGDVIPQQWMVRAVMLMDPDLVQSLPAGVVVAADLDLAAEQVCNRLPSPGLATGVCYLLATPSSVQIDPVSGRLVTVARSAWVKSVRQAADGWACGSWVPAHGVLGALHPEPG